MAKLNKTILVADDETTTQNLLREILSEAGYSVLVADDGVHALGLIEKTPVDLLIADRSMPRMGGLELLAELKKKRISVPALVISGYGEESFWGTAIGLGAADYLLKPFQADEVLKIVEKAMKGTRP